jgi:hypothetical protein
MRAKVSQRFFIVALLISLLLHVAFIFGLIYWGHLKLKPTNAPRLNIQFVNTTDMPKQLAAEAVQQSISKAIVESKPIAEPESLPNSSGWGMQREQKRSMATEQKSQMESRIGFERMQRQGNVNLSIANIMSSLHQQGIQVSCDLRLSEDFSNARITCLPSPIEGYMQSLLGPANLRWDKEGTSNMPICISINSLGGTRKTCQ